MSGRLLEQARAFEMIAPHLSDERRAEIAEHIAKQMIPTKAAPAAETLPVFESDRRPEYTLAEHDPVVRFLASLGYAEGDLSRAASRLWSAARGDCEHREVAALTDKYLAGLWEQINA